MRDFPKTGLIPLIILLLCGLQSVGQNTQVPPISWSCPMHPDVIEESKGKCSVCGMNLVPTRIGYTWSCPVHPVIDETHPGTCPICSRDLVQMTVSVTYVCPNRPKTEHLNPGKCSDGRAMIPKHTVRAHGNHSPQYGGIFFMASDNWHHLEGAHPEANTFRLYLYDDYSKTLPAGQMKQVTATVTRKNTMLPLKLDAGGKFFEAKVDGLAPPDADLVARVKFKKDGPEYRFDFMFPAFTKVGGTASPVPVTASSETDVSQKTEDLVRQLIVRKQEIVGLIEKGRFGEIYVPAFQAKEIALALDLRSAEMPALKRAAASASIERLVRAAWQLDAAGDVGDRDLIASTFETFARALDEVTSAFSPGRQ